ncbi:hypothetical protein UFOVP786_46 [uncultured Caudovirales phage]|uniref:Uncharacterized protein n=1 Tax=uncultured Caudovirales phage TaxID=2100421 RepID=A0A6J5NSN2_9CAUD|nr:hypothetical protein UFOVP786_46 [uncultured Caudovirales phage]
MEIPLVESPVVIEGGRRLLTNSVDGRAADIWKRAKAATNAPVIIGKPGGRYKDVSAVGLWVDASFTGGLSAFWQEVYRIEAARS